jgi:hypothetical protein
MIEISLKLFILYISLAVMLFLFSAEFSVNYVSDKISQAKSAIRNSIDKERNTNGPPNISNSPKSSQTVDTSSESIRLVGGTNLLDSIIEKSSNANNITTTDKICNLIVGNPKV